MWGSIRSARRALSRLWLARLTRWISSSEVRRSIGMASLSGCKCGPEEAVRRHAGGDWEAITKNSEGNHEAMRRPIHPCRHHVDITWM